MTNYKYTPEMREISGLGGGYEHDCRKMVITGLKWLDKHPNADPKFTGYREVFGLISEDNHDAKKLSATVGASVPTCSGAGHHAAIAHILHIKEVGWSTYVKEMTV